jgi:hypothetical protein
MTFWLSSLFFAFLEAAVEKPLWQKKENQSAFFCKSRQKKG